jgi:ketosteroid isomerase-like protein
MMTSIAEATIQGRAPAPVNPLQDIVRAVQDVELGWNSGDVRRILSNTAEDVTFQKLEPQPDGSRKVTFVRGKRELGALIEQTVGAHHDFTVERAYLVDDRTALVDQRIVLTGIRTPDGELPPITLYATTLWVSRAGKWVGKDIRVY